MDTINYSGPDDFKDPVPAHVPEHASWDISEQIGELIDAGETEKARALFEAELLKGIRSPKAPTTDQDWADIRTEVRRRHEARNSQGNNAR